MIKKGEKRQEKEQMEKLREKAKEFKDKMERKGVCYLSRVPPGLTVAKIKEYFQMYKIERVFLRPEAETRRIERKMQGGNFQRRYEAGWIEFIDKEIAKFVAQTFNGQKIGAKKGDAHFDDFWQIRYLPKFKWENLIELGVQEQQERKKKLQKRIEAAKKEHDDFIGKAEKAKEVKGLLRRKAKKILEEEGEDRDDENEIKRVINNRLIKKKKA